MFWWGLTIGLFIGANVGVVVMATFKSSRA